MIKFWSYDREYKKYKKIILKNIDKTINRGNIFFGDQIKNFEKNFIKKYKAKYGIAVGSGTDALLISLKTLNLKPGDEVITAANTAIPTISAIINAGGKPKLVDIREDYQNKGLCKPLLKNSMIWINSLFERKKEFYIDNASRTSYGIPACYCYFNAGIELGYKVDYLDPEAIKNYSNNDPELSKANLMVMNKDKNCIINNVPERMYYVLPHVSKKIKKAFNAIIFINKLKKSQASI